MKKTHLQEVKQVYYNYAVHNVGIVKSAEAANQTTSIHNLAQNCLHIHLVN
jgi:hypothetical protein